MRYPYAPCSIEMGLFHYLAGHTFATQVNATAFIIEQTVYKSVGCFNNHVKERR